jgi:hypothetical protein
MQQIISAPDPYILILTGAGLLIALVAWLPLPTRHRARSSSYLMVTELTVRFIQVRW